ncbi:VanZ family protein [Gemella sp. GH3]|uniref:VanZ family protein n=1 Tax=unclassified Gemella TaxID=2624949 RepID=UPI0015D0BCCB|nr:MULTISPECIES: VanZ family protein [unclassified Gemella]MBF0713946.1 VanZ family protein [Gemella sp. GH3.1]NYS50898.1 VanZ family protein [Gemella sp. GH3]
MTQNKDLLITKILFSVYLIFLTWIIIFKMEADIIAFLTEPVSRTINTIPYKYMNPMEVFLNILIFIPFGIYSSVTMPKTNNFNKIFLAFTLSLFYEASQFIFAIGMTDITDLIDNTLGAIIGIIIFKIFDSLFERYTKKAINIISVAIMFIFIYIIYKYSLI